MSRKFAVVRTLYAMTWDKDMKSTVYRVANETVLCETERKANMAKKILDSLRIQSNAAFTSAYVIHMAETNIIPLEMNIEGKGIISGAMPIDVVKPKERYGDE